MPVKRVAPFIQSVACRQVLDILQIKTVTCGGILCKQGIQPVYKRYPSVGIDRIHISQKAVVRKFKIVLDNDAAVGFL